MSVVTNSRSFFIKTTKLIMKNQSDIFDEFGNFIRGSEESDKNSSD